MFEKFKKVKNDVPIKEQKQVLWTRYSNKDISREQKVVFNGSVTDCQGYLRAQAIESNNELKSLESDGITVRVYKSKPQLTWIRVELLSMEEDKVGYYSSTYEIL